MSVKKRKCGKKLRAGEKQEVSFPRRREGGRGGGEADFSSKKGKDSKKREEGRVTTRPEVYERKSFLTKKGDPRKPRDGKTPNRGTNSIFGRLGANELGGAHFGPFWHFAHTSLRFLKSFLFR